MKWQKKGVIFETAGQHPWMVSHACVPTALLLEDKERIRIYFAPRNKKGQSIPTFIDVDAEDPSRVLKLHDKPILELGERGTFDDGGIMPCSVVRNKSDIFLYYVGWNPSGSVPYRNAIGLAVSSDGGTTFERMYPGAIVDRNKQEPFFTASPCVMKEDDTWHMWYASSTGFVEVNGSPEPLYVIKYASSDDGIDWHRKNHTCIEPNDKYESNARATVIKEDGMYKMWFAYRGSFDFRDGTGSYSIGYTESEDAVHWQRKDEQAGISYSEKGWDSTMQTYPNVLEMEKKRYLFYNGNGFGKTGIGYAVQEI
jgi:predicted GH43/DUF377 family glycosyl hydrolase